MIRTLQVQIENPVNTLEQEIARFGPWFHNLHLPDGTQTAPNHPLGNFPQFKWEELKQFVPADLTGWRVLDIGCNSGFYTFELAKRGAIVTAIDLDEHYLKQARWAARQYELEDKVEFKCMPLFDLARSEETYDLIWFMGVLYHLRYPLLAMDIIARKVERLLVLQCLTTNDDEIADVNPESHFPDIEKMSKPGWPSMAFVEHELLGDPTNWWLPNEAGLQAMIRSSGLKFNAHPAPGTYICQPDRKAQPFAHMAQLESATGARSSAAGHR